MALMQQKALTYVTTWHGDEICRAFTEGAKTVNAEGLTVVLRIDVILSLEFDMRLGNYAMQNFPGYEILLRDAAFQFIETQLHPHTEHRLQKQQLVVYVSLFNLPFSEFCPIVHVEELNRVYRLYEGHAYMPVVSFRGVVMATKSPTNRLWCQTFQCGRSTCTGSEERILHNRCDNQVLPYACGRCQTPLVENGAQRVHTVHQEFYVLEAIASQNRSGAQTIKASIAGDHLVQQIPLGALVEIIGVPELRLKKAIKTNTTTLGTIALLATSFRVISVEIPRSLIGNPSFPCNDDDPWRFTLDVVRSFGDRIVPPSFSSTLKLGLLLSIISAGCPPNEQLNHEGKQIRSQIHVLIAGSAGEHLRRFISCEIKARRHVIHTTGKLVPSMVFSKYPNYVIEAGSLALSNGGMCFIPYLSTLNKNSELSLLHDAMDKQMMVVGKRDQYENVKCNTTVVACCNLLKCVEAECTTIEERLDFKNAANLLPCFDLCFVVDDSSESDENLVSMILRAHSTEPTPHEPVVFAAPNPGDRELKEIILNASGRTTKLGEKGHKLLQSYWLLLRKYSCGPSLKMMDVLVRCAVAHAKLVGNPIVGMADCLIAIMLVEETLVAKNGTESPILRFRPLPCGRRNIDTYGKTSAEQYQNFARHVAQKIRSTQGLGLFQKEE